MRSVKQKINRLQEARDIDCAANLHPGSDHAETEHSWSHILIEENVYSYHR